MKQRIKLAAARLLSLHVEFSKEEIQEALIFIEKKGLDQIFEIQASKIVKNDSRASSLNKKSETTPSISRVVLEQEKLDPVKFGILRDFDSLLRSEKVLPRLEQIRKVGVSIDKTFETGKSRKEAIPRFLELLVNMPTSDMKEFVLRLSKEGDYSNRRDDEYRDLATFLINKKP